MPFEESVARQVAMLRSASLVDIEREVARKRREWMLGRLPASDGPLTPRDGYRLFCLDYLGLAESDVPVVSESESEIVWASRNPCPTLEACRRMGLDTRLVCRGAYEKSTQAFLSAADPALRFLRSYEEIRPHAAACLERIVRVDLEAMMALALEEAVISRREGNKGYGAVAALGSRILARGHDTALTAGDPSLHAEVNAIRQAVAALGDWNLSGAMLFSTCEPCPMCSALAVWANVTAVAYGASIEETARLGRTRIRLGVEEMAARSPVMIEVIPGVLAERCRGLYEG
jgi:tRNA(Arg) A34 adenosine deaminase TadA